MKKEHSTQHTHHSVINTFSELISAHFPDVFFAKIKRNSCKEKTTLMADVSTSVTSLVYGNSAGLHIILEV